MAIFPAITPAKRRYGFGEIPVTVEAGFAGSYVRFSHGQDRYGVSLDLGYELITQAEAQQIRTHYRVQDGGHVAFTLPNVIWAGHSSPDNIVPLGTQWIYADELDERHLSGRLFNVGVKLLQLI